MREPRVVIVRADGDEAIFERLSGEMTAWRWQVRSTQGQQPSENLADVAQQYSAVAAIRVRPDAGEVEIWVGDRARGTTEVHETFSVEDTREADLLAFRAAETLRARLVRLGIVEADENDEPDKPSDRRAVAPMRTEARPSTHEPGVVSRLPSEEGPDRPFLLLAGLAVPTDAPNLVRGASVHIGTIFRPAPAWALGAHGLLPFAAQELDAPEGSATFRTYWFWLDADWSYRSDPYFASLGPGIGNVMLSTDGEAAAPFVAHNDTATTFAVMGHTTLGYRISPRLRLRGDFLLAYTFEPLIVQFSARDVFRVERPSMAVSLGAELGL